MKKVEQLLKTQTLPKYLMADGEFVKEAKSIFNEKGLELSNENLENFLQKIQENLTGKNFVDDEKLTEVFGGISKEASEKTVEALIRTSTTIIGTVAGIALGAVFGFSSTTTKTMTVDGKKETVTGKTTKKTFSGAAPLGFGALGGFIGEKLGELIVKKIN